MRISDWSSDVCSSDLGLLLPGILQNFPQQGYIERHQLNGALQWQASPSLEAYVEGFYTYFRDRGSRNGANIQPFTTGTTIVDGRSEEHTSELQSLMRISYAVFCLKKKNNT